MSFCKALPNAVLYNAFIFLIKYDDKKGGIY